MTVRNVKKNLAGQQDLLPGVGPYSQIRRGVAVSMDGPAKSYIELWKSYCGNAYVGTFEDGFTATTGNVAVSLISGRAYRYTGATPVTVAKDSSPDISWSELVASTNSLFVTLEQYGVSTANTPAANAIAFKAAIESGHHNIRCFGVYEFDFTGMTALNISNSAISLDMGGGKHTIKNFPRITATDALTSLEVNIRFTAAGTRLRGLFEAYGVEFLRSGVVEITDVYNPTGLPADQLFVFELNKEGGPDVVRQVDMGVVKIVNVKTRSNTSVEGNTCPMTLLGGYGYAVPKLKQHTVNIASLHVEEFFSVNASSQVIDGDSDVFRFFTNPTALNIGSVTFINSAKRLLKSQQRVISDFTKLYIALDSRFTGANFVAAIDFQNAVSGLTSRAKIGHLVVDCQDYDSAGIGKPRVFTASGLNGHSFKCGECKFKKLGVFFSSVSGSIVFESADGIGANINASLADVELHNFKDSNFEGVLSAKTRMSDFDVTINAQAPGSFKITNAILTRGNIAIPTTEYRVASLISASDVKLTYAAITTDRRPFQPAASAVRIDDVSVVGGAAGTQLMDAPATPSTGTITVSRFRSVTRGIAFMSSGTWKFKLDDCDLDTTVAGSGVVSSLKVQYL